MCDKTFAIAMSKNLVFHQRSKHIKRNFHPIREATEEGIIGFVAKVKNSWLTSSLKPWLKTYSIT